MVALAKYDDVVEGCLDDAEWYEKEGKQQSRRIYDVRRVHLHPLHPRNGSLKM
jgi:hypothetical protein